VTRRVGYSPQAQRHLTDLYDWIAHESGFPDRAEAYVTALMDRCDALADFPMVGRARDDIRPGLRTIGFRRRAVIAFAITDEMIEIIGVYYGGPGATTEFLSGYAKDARLGAEGYAAHRFASSVIEPAPPAPPQPAFRQKTVDALAQLADLLLQGCHLRPRGGLLLGVLLLDQRDDPRGQGRCDHADECYPPDHEQRGGETPRSGPSARPCGGR